MSNAKSLDTIGGITNELLSTLTLSGCGVVFLFFMLAYIRIAIAESHARMICIWLKGATSEKLLSSDVPKQLRSFSRWLRSEFVGRTRGDASGEARIIVRQSPAGVLRELLEKAFYQEAWASLGNALTGIALICTFLLIAYVLAGDMHAALIDSGNDKSSANNLLAQAVADMGSKFLISATGVLLSLLHRVLLNRTERRLDLQRDAAIDRVQLLTISLDEVRLQNERSTIEGIVDLRGGISELQTSMEHLRSIRVSVQELGAQVSEGLGRMMRDALAEQISHLLAEAGQRIGDIQRDIESVTRAALKETADLIVAELGGMHATMRSQGAPQVDTLLARVQDMVTGGFSSESKNMSERLAMFGETIPRLSEQLGAVADRMGGVLEGLADQQRQSRANIDAIATASSTHAERLGADLAQRGGEALQGVFGELARGVFGLLEQMQALQASSQTSSAQLRGNLQETSAAVRDALSEAKGTAEALQGQLGRVTEALRASAGNAAAIGAIATQLGQAVGALQGSVRQMSEVGQTHTALLASQASTQAAQQQLLEQMQRVWPGLLEAIATQVQRSTGDLSGAWEKASREVTQVMLGQIDGFTEAVEKLSGSVDRFAGGVNGRNGR